MSRLTVAQAQAWNPDALRDTADEWDAAAADLRSRVDGVVLAIEGSRDFWTGSAADAARGRGATISADGALATRCLITAAVA
ncbi:MAG TPA: alpha/beta hydrolase, partial [Mycobacterium sp.]|nr:alpha/beta hydrolase [Mycobacterium sp.]